MKYLHILGTVYAVIFEGHKFHGFHCKLVERKILMLEGLRKQCTAKVNHTNPSDLSSPTYKTLKIYCLYICHAVDRAKKHYMLV